MKTRGDILSKKKLHMPIPFLFSKSESISFEVHSISLSSLGTWHYWSLSLVDYIVILELLTVPSACVRSFTLLCVDWDSWWAGDNFPETIKNYNFNFIRNEAVVRYCHRVRAIDCSLIISLPVSVVSHNV